ncbi:MAG: YchJ family protein [Spirochaetales bacterium]|nr:YchJ family protein [Spirochaetales bacterium]
MSSCPCGSGKELDVCCKPYISGSAKAPTAEALMRSRYTAYTLVEVDYIVKTHDSKTRDEISKEETKNWAENSQWMGLDIVRVVDGQDKDSTGIVEFKAYYKQNGIKYTHHEEAQFTKKRGDWFFTDSKIVNKPVVRDGEKVGRNDPCPCGSGKKYKKCCG